MTSEKQAAQERKVRRAELVQLARYARERHDLYKAKSYGPSLTSPTRLRKLARERDLAERRLREADTG
jgi:hypothetical protein